MEIIGGHVIVCFSGTTDRETRKEAWIPFPKYSEDQPAVVMATTEEILGPSARDLPEPNGLLDRGDVIRACVYTATSRSPVHQRVG